jgi:adenylyltransferase/sulfurtransferase
MPKAAAAKAHLERVNSEVDIRAEVSDFEYRNAEKLADGATLILDATDNFETRFLINDLAVKHGIPWIYAGCVSSRAVCMPVIPGRTSCLRCMLEDQPNAGGETCDTTGIIMPAVLQAVAWSSGAALKLLSGNVDALILKLISVDVWTGERQVLDASTPREECPTCARKEYSWLNGDRATRHAELCGRNSVQIRPNGAFDYDSARHQIGTSTRIDTENEYLLRAAFEDVELTLYRDGRALVHGTDSVERARSIYSRLVGN